MDNKLTTGVKLAVFSGALMLSVSSAMAAGFAIREQSAIGQSMSYAGAAAGYSDLSSMYFNPATITLHGGLNAQNDVSLIVPVSKSKNGAATTKAGVASGGASSSGNIGVTAVVPSFYSSLQVTPDLYLGLAVNAPFGLATKANSGWAGRYHGIESDIFTLNVNPVFGYEISPLLSIGGGPMLQYMKVKLTSAVDYDAIVLGGARVAGLRDGFNKTTGDSFGYGFNFGFLVKPTQTTRIGLGFRSAIKQTLKGKSRTTSASTALLPAPAVAGFAAVTAALNGKITGKVTTPETVTLGIRQQVTDKLALSGGIEWANWSRFKELKIAITTGATSTTTENWKDSWFFSLGGEYRFNDYATLRMGAAYEISSVPDATRTPRLPDNDRIWLSIGGGYKIADWLSLNAGFTHIFVQDSTVNLTAAGNDLNRGSLTAKFGGHIDIASVSAKISF